MGRIALLKRRRAANGVTRTELLAVLGMLVIFAAVVHPVFQQPRSSPNGAVRDSSGKPMPGAVLRFRDPAGHIIATITADKEGQFQRSDLDALSKNAAAGFGLSDLRHRSGSSDVYVFSPLETQSAIFRDESGKPVPGLAVAFGPDHSTWHHQEQEPFQQVSDRTGSIQIHQRPVGTRIEFQSRDPRYVVERFQKSDDGKTIQYAVTLTTPGTITGCLHGEDGRPLAGYKVFATISPDLDRFDRWYANSLVTGPTGRFRITDLRPRVYYVSAAPAPGFRAAALAQCVTLASGQTTEVSLRVETKENRPDVH